MGGVFAGRLLFYAKKKIRQLTWNKKNASLLKSQDLGSAKKKENKKDG